VQTGDRRVIILAADLVAAGYTKPLKALDAALFEGRIHHHDGDRRLSGGGPLRLGAAMSVGGSPPSPLQLEQCGERLP